MNRYARRLQSWTGAFAAAAIIAAGTPAAAQAPASSAAVAEMVRTYAADHDFNGTVLVARDGEVLTFESFGLAERAFGVPAANDTRYWIASVTKLFTSALIMQMVERGEIGLQAPVRTYLPDFAGDPSITVHSLLNHTSGLPNPDAGADPTKGVPMYQLPHTPAQLVADYASAPLAHPVGTHFDYSNADYYVLGRIIEVVSGQPFEEVLKARILTPLGMPDSGMLRQSDIIPRLASSYFRMGDDQPLINDLPVYNENWFAGGGMYSDADDLLTFAEALYGGRVVSAESLQRMLTPGLDDYGYGQWIWDIEAGGRKYPTYVRFGGVMGANAVLFRVGEANVTVVILSNTNLTDMGSFGRKVAEKVLE
ncbi:serine hydrolase domain-containing protein [Brevundimonas lenta]|uniref:CubicO group peptidase (Beta-lactamase class C family) n=1 Tax=Brevundimonas lenta TaxID=424796 RepID=A0A7W6JE55_9CAUL|nr:serine hydrolase domain-containing protein [Brevundimonas lenta]MBB4083436.1 CubicO group peptidase (beta-lactamase class C family) [Brevundimonas lenta]